MDLIYRLQRHSGLTQTERHLRDYILQNPEQAAVLRSCRNIRSIKKCSRRTSFWVSTPSGPSRR